MVGAPAKPQAKLTAYAFFVRICREEHKRRFPEEKVDYAEFSRKCKDRWKIMSDSEKKRFNVLAEADKKRWKVEKKSYDVSQGKKGKVKKIQDPNAPKKLVSSYFLYMNVMRSRVRREQPGLSMLDVCKTLGRMWAELGPEGREQYEARTLVAKAQYDKDKAAYDAGKIGEEQD